MGFSEALTYLPTTHAHYKLLLARHLRHIRRMVELQQPDGSWLQLLDHAGSYHEMSATCMTGYALARGIRGGWLPQDEFLAATKLAWQAASHRIDEAAGLVDVCAGTGPQRGEHNTAHAYINRPAVSGFDDRGGSMALWFAVEMAMLCAGSPLERRF
jgi:rhamnogalacturonyl hydrolase YesR